MSTKLLFSAMRLAADTRLGRYEILSLLGAGGMGEVYLAQDTQLRRPVAIKLLPPEFSQHKDRLHHFEQEAYAVAALNHPNIAHIYSGRRARPQKSIPARTSYPSAKQLALSRGTRTSDAVLIKDFR